MTKKSRIDAWLVVVARWLSTVLGSIVLVGCAVFVGIVAVIQYLRHRNDHERINAITRAVLGS